MAVYPRYALHASYRDELCTCALPLKTCGLQEIFEAIARDAAPTISKTDLNELVGAASCREALSQ